MSLGGGVPPIRSSLLQPDNSLQRDWSIFFSFVGQMAQTGSGIVQSGTRAQRLKSSVDHLADNTLFIETDTGVTYRSLQSGKWAYVSGKYNVAQADIPANLNSDDDGVLCWVTDYRHMLQWNAAGPNWKWADGEEETAGTGPHFREVDPVGPGWHLYDGTAGVHYLKPDGTLGTITLRDFTTPRAILGALANAAVAAAVAPTLGGSGSTDLALTGITNPATTGSAGALTTSGPSATNNVTATGITSVASGGHTHTGAAHTHTIGAPTDPEHAHTLSGVTIGDNGMPPSVQCKSWFRQ